MTTLNADNDSKPNQIPQRQVLIVEDCFELKEMGIDPNNYQNLAESGNYQLVRISKSKIQQS